jgi:hypothetical protein
MLNPSRSMSSTSLNFEQQSRSARNQFWTRPSTLCTKS